MKDFLWILWHYFLLTSFFWGMLFAGGILLIKEKFAKKNYKIVFKFINTGSDTDGKWKESFLDNNGRGFKLEFAETLAQELKGRGNIKNIEIVEMEKLA